MDPLLMQLESSGLGLSIKNYMGGFLHADHSTSAESLQEKLQTFAVKHFLKLNIQKCEVVVFTANHQEGVYTSV